jgi:hypothetical protein
MPFDRDMSNSAVGQTDRRDRASAANPSRGRVRHLTSAEAKRKPTRSLTVRRADAADTIARPGLVPRVIQLMLTEIRGGAR